MDEKTIPGIDPALAPHLLSIEFTCTDLLQVVGTMLSPLSDIGEGHAVAVADATDRACSLSQHTILLSLKAIKDLAGGAGEDCLGRLTAAAYVSYRFTDDALGGGIASDRTGSGRVCEAVMLAVAMLQAVASVRAHGVLAAAMTHNLHSLLDGTGVSS